MSDAALRAAIEEALSVSGPVPEVSCAGYTTADDGCYVFDLAKRIRTAMASVPAERPALLALADRVAAMPSPLMPEYRQDLLARADIVALIRAEADAGLDEIERHAEKSEGVVPGKHRQ